MIDSESLMNRARSDVEEQKLIISVVASGGTLIGIEPWQSNFDSSALIWSGYKLYDKTTRYQRMISSGKFFF
jgi:hypothetical protein